VGKPTEAVPIKNGHQSSQQPEQPGGRVVRGLSRQRHHAWPQGRHQVRFAV